VNDVFRRILWATDGSEGADKALDVAKAIAAEHGATLTIGHVLQKIATSGEKALAWHADEEIVAKKLEGIESELSQSGLTVDLKIVTHVGPSAADVIADLAREDGNDLIVVGTRGHTALAGLVLGSVTERLLHVAPCPVLVIPSPRGSTST
jgi:nucleotide-binding universal stress UspA family protein